MDMDPEQLAAFAERLAKERALFKTATAFCKKAGITRTTLRALEGGKQQPKQKTINRLAIALGIPAEALTGKQRIASDNPKLENLTEDDLVVAQMFHHAGLAVKHRTLGVMQERQPPHSAVTALSAEVSTLAKRLLALNPTHRYVMSALLAELETIGGLDVTTLAWAKRLQALKEDDRQIAATAIVDLENRAQEEEEKKKSSRSGPPRKK